MRKWMVLPVALLTMLAVACGSDSHDAKTRELPTATVEVTSLDAGRGGEFFETVGRVKKVRESMLTGKVMGRVVDIRVKPGDVKKKGAVLMRLDHQDISGQVNQAKGALAQAQAALEIAQTNYDRFVELKKTGSASQAEFDKANFDLESARGAVAQAKGALATALSYQREAVVTMPFDGTVVDTLIEQGEQAAPGRPLVKVEGGDELEFETLVNERDVHTLQVGQDATVVVDPTGEGTREVKGVIGEIVPSSDPGTHSNTVRVKLTDTTDLRSGMFGRARFAAAADRETAGVWLPRDILIHQGQLVGVFVVDAQNVVRLRLVKTGSVMGGQHEILSGLATDDRLVVGRHDDLIDGQPAEVVEK